jgi:hypothetical protein
MRFCVFFRYGVHVPFLESVLPEYSCHDNGIQVFLDALHKPSYQILTLDPDTLMVGREQVMRWYEDPEAGLDVEISRLRGTGERILNMTALAHVDRDDPFSPVIVP